MSAATVISMRLGPTTVTNGHRNGSKITMQPDLRISLRITNVLAWKTFSSILVVFAIKLYNSTEVSEVPRGRFFARGIQWRVRQCFNAPRMSRRPAVNAPVVCLAGTFGSGRQVQDWV